MEKLRNERVIIRLDETSSTNSTLKLLQQKDALPEGSLVIADFQTSGRGQAGNTWYSSKGKNLLFSLLLYPKQVRIKDQFIISRIVSLAIKHLLNKYLKQISIKWPNDIYWQDKKIAGILIENSLIGSAFDYSIIGVGLNVNEEKFPAQLPNPISIKQIIGYDLNLNLLLENFWDELFLLKKRIQLNETLLIEQEYMNSLYRGEGVHWFSDNSGKFCASIKNVLPSGHLVLSTYPEEEERVYAFKEVQFLMDKNDTESNNTVE